MGVDCGAEVLHRGSHADECSHFRYQIRRMRAEDMAAEYMAVLGHYSLDKSIRLPQSHGLAVGAEE